MENDHHAWRMAKSTTSMFQVTQVSGSEFPDSWMIEMIECQKKDKTPVTPVLFLGWYPLVN